MFSYRSLAFFSVLALGIPTWAESPSVPGIHNFREVDQNVYRGAQPSDEGYKYLAKIGVKVVLDLRGHDSRSDSEEQAVIRAGMKYINVPMTGLTPPNAAETKTVLALLEDPAAGPVFVHCRRGADRTGAVVAAYRMDHCKWDNARALQEAMADGMSRFEVPRQNYIRSFQVRIPEAAPAMTATTTAQVVSANGGAPTLAAVTAVAGR